jgi:hypothetical protein
MKRRLLRIAHYALYTFACMIAVYTLILWIREPSLSYMALLLRYWYWFLIAFVSSILGGVCYVLEDQ